MSDKPEGPGWWIASDGKWYPPELHPTVKGDAAVTTANDRRNPAPPADGTNSPKRWQGQADRRVGPQFPDLFQKAMQGSHLADSVSVKYDGADERNGRNGRAASSPAKSGSGTKRGNGQSVAAGVTGATIGAPPAKRRWRKSR
jgi:hypothetical protein